MLLDGIKSAAFVGAHSDDEIVAAGTLHRLARQGCEVHVLTFAPAAIATDRQGGPESLKVVWPEWHRSLDAIGVAKDCRRFHPFMPSADLHPHRQSICQVIFDFVEAEKPDAVFCLSPEDENPAHRIVAEETERVLRGRVPVAIRCHFPWCYSAARLNLCVSLTPEDLAVKRRVMECYESQMFRYRYADILHHAAVSAGLSVKVEAAETFEILRMVV